MGHVLGLYHTHHGTYSGETSSSTCAELVNGSNSDVCGDLIEDTPADPFLGFNVNPITGQWLSSGATDANGDPYQPDTHLIMSYTHPLCMSYFSTKQGEKMRYAIQNIPALQNATISADMIVGPKIISTNGVYYINDLPSCLTVEWSLSDIYYNQNCLWQNNPSPNECKITRDSNHDMIYEELTATIKYNGVAVQTLTKNICAYAGFKGTYISSLGSGVFNAPNPILTEPNTYVHLLSPSLIGATYSYTGDATPTYWLPGYDTLDVGMPSTGSTILIHVYCTNGEDFYLPIIKYGNPYNLFVVFDGDIMTITLDESVSEEQAWTFELYNMVNGEKVITQNVSGNSISLNTSGWKRGLYAVRATIDKEVLIEKVVVK